MYRCSVQSKASSKFRCQNRTGQRSADATRRILLFNSPADSSHNSKTKTKQCNTPYSTNCTRMLFLMLKCVSATNKCFNCHSFIIKARDKCDLPFDDRLSAQIVRTRDILQHKNRMHSEFGIRNIQRIQRNSLNSLPKA